MARSLPSNVGVDLHGINDILFSQKKEPCTTLPEDFHDWTKDYLYKTMEKPLAFAENVTNNPNQYNPEEPTTAPPKRQTYGKKMPVLFLPIEDTTKPVPQLTFSSTTVSVPSDISAQADTMLALLGDSL